MSEDLNRNPKNEEEKEDNEAKQENEDDQMDMQSGEIGKKLAQQVMVSNSKFDPSPVNEQDIEAE